MSDKVVLAYSGGLDTSVAIRWLKENYNLDVVAFSPESFIIHFESEQEADLFGFVRVESGLRFNRFCPTAIVGPNPVIASTFAGASRCLDRPYKKTSRNRRWAS